MAWTSVPKPAETLIISPGGDVEPFGLLIAITSVMSTVTSVSTGWGNVVKPATASWAAVSKPTSSIWTIVSKPSS